MEVDAITWFFAIVGSGVVNALLTYFIQKFVVKPIDKRIDKLAEAIVATQNREERDFAEIEKKFMVRKK